MSTVGFDPLSGTDGTRDTDVEQKKPSTFDRLDELATSSLSSLEDGDELIVTSSAASLAAAKKNADVASGAAGCCLSSCLFTVCCAIGSLCLAAIGGCVTLLTAPFVCLWNKFKS